jgi:hypothetical protein
MSDCMPWRLGTLGTLGTSPQTLHDNGPGFASRLPTIRDNLSGLT